MKKSKFTEEQIVFALKQAEGGTPISEITRRLGVTEATFYRWKQKYGGLLPSEVKKMKQLEEENVRLKRLVADLTLDKQMLQDVLSKKW
jgi:putative transposase